MSLETPDWDMEELDFFIQQHVKTDFDALRYRDMLYEYDMLILTDLDGVFNTGYPIFFAYLKGLAEENKKIKENFNKITKLVKDIKPGNVDDPVSKIEGIFLDSDVRLWQHENACTNLDKYLEAPNKLALGLAHLTYSGFNDIYCISGSPDKPVKDFVNEKMGIPFSRAYGSIYQFEDKSSEAKFTGIYPVIYEYKTQVVESILQKRGRKGREDRYVAVVSDEPGDINMAISFPHLLILVDDEPRDFNEDDYIIVTIPNFSKDSCNLARTLMKIKRALWFYNEFNEKGREEILESAIQLKNCVENVGGEGVALNHLKDRCVDNLRKYMRGFFGSEYEHAYVDPIFFSKMEAYASRLEFSFERADIIKELEGLWEEFQKYSPDAQIAQVYKKRIKG